MGRFAEATTDWRRGSCWASLGVRGDGSDYDLPMAENGRNDTKESRHALHRLLLDFGAGLSCEPQDLDDETLLEAAAITSHFLAENQPISFEGAAAVYSFFRCGSEFALRKGDLRDGLKMESGADEFLDRLVGTGSPPPLAACFWLDEFATLARVRRVRGLSGEESGRFRKLEEEADNFARERIGNEGPRAGEFAGVSAGAEFSTQTRTQAAVESMPRRGLPLMWRAVALYAALAATFGDDFRDASRRVATMFAAFAGAASAGLAVPRYAGEHPWIVLATPALVTGALTYAVVGALWRVGWASGCVVAVLITVGSAAVIYVAFTT